MLYTHILKRSMSRVQPHEASYNIYVDGIGDEYGICD